MTTMFWYPPILTYHRVHAEVATDTPTVSPAAFEQQMAILARRWRSISLNTLVAWLDRRGTLPRRAVVVTFDDGEDNLGTYAWPLLRRYRIPATLFVIADNVGRPGFLTWEALRQMAREGIAIGSHTLHHAYLPSLSPDQVQDEVVQSRQRLEQGLGHPVEFLSYPGGGFTPAVQQAVREAGYQAACTTNRGLRRFSVDRWALRRITMHASAGSILGIWCRCCGYYSTLRRRRAPS